MIPMHGYDFVVKDLAEMSSSHSGGVIWVTVGVYGDDSVMKA